MSNEFKERIKLGPNLNGPTIYIVQDDEEQPWYRTIDRIIRTRDESEDER